MERHDSDSTAQKDMEVLRQNYLGDILGAKRATALERIMTAFHSGYSIPNIYMDIFQESLYEIGRLWETNRIGVAEEHMGTAITQFIMSNLYQHLEMSDTRRGRLVITGVQGELHQVGANMVADVLEADGWDVMFLGADVPPESVVQAVLRHRADVLGISVTMFVNVPVVIALVGMLRKEFGDRAPKILLGGGAFNGIGPLPSELEGCLLARDLREAVELARTVVIKGEE